MNTLRFSLIIFFLISSISFVDIILDWEAMHGLNAHILVELAIGVISLTAFIVLFYNNQKQKKQILETTSHLNVAQEALEDAEHRLKKLMGEFSAIIQAQFTNWNFTQSEKEVALLLLKGLSLDEIAGVRDTKEKTVRQQASNLYKKAGLSGRHELVAYFFEDLLV